MKGNTFKDDFSNAILKTQTSSLAPIEVASLWRLAFTPPQDIAESGNLTFLKDTKCSAPKKK
ncbi:hypothetical protein SLW70_13135 [Flavobacterium sp. NG2]|uniref:hypothetical protein n=1 Tax=Flavobacterium sp. NG2 TaxID=3097547 RepID=UPI002A8021CB|nr:hypothetical protein [Flavobacterium sp. NG2]WPR70868.1 hypothetical protein SLW70_13135 [Flavobacterium sp. NG2]